MVYSDQALGPLWTVEVQKLWYPHCPSSSLEWPVKGLHAPAPYLKKPWSCHVLSGHNASTEWSTDVQKHWRREKAPVYTPTYERLQTDLGRREKRETKRATPGHQKNICFNLALSNRAWIVSTDFLRHHSSADHFLERSMQEAFVSGQSLVLCCKFPLLVCCAHLEPDHRSCGNCELRWCVFFLFRKATWISIFQFNDESMYCEVGFASVRHISLSVSIGTHQDCKRLSGLLRRYTSSALDTQCPRHTEGQTGMPRQ